MTLQVLCDSELQAEDHAFVVRFQHSLCQYVNSSSILIWYLAWYFTSLYFLSNLCVATEAPSASNVEFFEKHVRPIFGCALFRLHSDDPKSDLRLDSSTGMLHEGLRGPALVPGKPMESLLIRAIQHGEILKMPPKSKLPQSEINHLIRWVEMGAPWPNLETGKNLNMGLADARGHDSTYDKKKLSFWSLQPTKAVV